MSGELQIGLVFLGILIVGNIINSLRLRWQYNKRKRQAIHIGDTVVYKPTNRIGVVVGISKANGMYDQTYVSIRTEYKNGIFVPITDVILDKEK